MKSEDLFGDIPVLVIGGVATRAYAPERTTNDIDFLFAPTDYENAKSQLRKAGYKKGVELFFPTTTLELRGEAWHKEQLEIDIITTDQLWLRAAFEHPTFDQTGLRVIPLPYLILMKYESARARDVGDIERMLAPLPDSQIEDIIVVVEQHSADPEVAEELRQFAELGRLELQRSPPIGDGIH